MLAMLELGYSFNPTRDQYASLRMCAPSLPEWDPAKEEVPWEAKHGAHLVDLDIAAGLLAEIGGDVKFKAFKNNLLLDINDKFRALERQMLLIKSSVQQNGQLMQVHVPNNKLIEFNEVEVYEDSCTNELQRALNEGWRIIAVCPPLEARRPTYIIGRHNPDIENV